METFSVQPASVYFTIIWAIKVALRKCSVLGELRDAQGPHSSLASKARGLQQHARLLACRHAAGSCRWYSAQPNGRKSESENPRDCFHWLQLGVSGFFFRGGGYTHDFFYFLLSLKPGSILGIGKMCCRRWDQKVSGEAHLGIFWDSRWRY